MKKKNLIKSLFTAVLIVTIPLSSFAHSGRTDSRGGHKDNKNKSGLGPYHYHCGGYPPHLHEGGVCPYKDGGTTTSAKSKMNLYARTSPVVNTKSL